MKLKELRNSNNVAELLEGKKLAEIAEQVMRGYEVDKASRYEWEQVIEKAMEIAKQTLTEKNFPFPHAANIKYPLITKGGIDFAARMLPEIIRNDQLVKITINGEDPQGLIARRAQRVQKHMSFQLLKQSDSWEQEMDKLLHVLPVLGTAFKKTYYDPFSKMPVSEMCLPSKIVVNYNTRDLEKARRITHEFTFFSNDILSRIRSGIYVDCDLDELRGTESNEDDTEDAPIELLEQHCWLDLDEDGFPEPYIVVLHKQARYILRIVSRIKNVDYNKKGEVVHIEPVHYFTDYHFIPSPDGGFYSLGFGTLLYPLNEAINTIFNQLIDSGTLHNNQSGFVGRGLRIKGGEFKLKLGEWKVLDASSGTNLQQNIVPLPTKEPSNVLFQLLGLLIEVGKDLTSTNDALEGKQPAQNVPATTILALIEQGMKVYSAITKRMFRAEKKELRKLFDINRENLTDDEYRKALNNQLVRVKDDYEAESYDIIPVADPTMASDAQRMAKANALISVPGLDPQAVTRYYLEALQIEGALIDKLIPKPDPNAPPPPEVQKLMAEVEKLKAEAENAKLEGQINQQKNSVEAEKLKVLQQDAQTRAKEAEARIVKMQRDSEEGSVKVQIAGAKADHAAQLNEVKLAHQQQKDQADLTIKSMGQLTEAYKVKMDAKKVEKDGNKSE